MWEFENRDVNDMGKVCYYVEDQRVLDLWQSEIEFDNADTLATKPPVTAE